MSWRLSTIVLIGIAGSAAHRHDASAQEQSADWYRGEQVVCVNNRFLDLSDAPELREGAVYTIKDILPRRRGFVGLAVVETAAKETFRAFDERRFRPLKIVAIAR